MKVKIKIIEHKNELGPTTFYTIKWKKFLFWHDSTNGLGDIRMFASKELAEQYRPGKKVRPSKEVVSTFEDNDENNWREVRLRNL